MHCSNQLQLLITFLITFLITNDNLQLLFLMEADHYKKTILDGNEKKYNAR